MRRLALLGMLVVAGAVWADESFIKSVTELKKRASKDLVRAKDDLALAKKGRVNAAYRGPKKSDKGFVFSSADEKRSAIAYFDAEINHWGKLLGGEFVPLPDEFKIGQIGIVKNEGLVTQVTSATSAIIDFNSAEARRSRTTVRIQEDAPQALERGTQEAFSTFQRNKRNSTMETYQTTRVIWLDTSTQEMVDGELARVSQPVIVIGTKTYDTIGGSTRTILHARTLSNAERDEYSRVMTTHVGDK